MRCAYSSTTCPADVGVPGRTGGDIVAVVETSAVVRVLVGDVMGHGRRAGATAAEVGKAFRQLAAHENDPPQVIAARLDQLVAGREDGKPVEDTCDAGGRRDREEFVTAQIIDVPRGPASMKPQIVNCGHPPPLVFSDGRATFLDDVPSAPPLGLLGLAEGTCPRSGPLGVQAGDMVLLYTDGVTEARDSRGVPYPFADRAGTVLATLAESLDEAIGNALIEALKTDLLAHVGAPLRDDATLMYLRLADDPCGLIPPQASRLSEDGTPLGRHLIAVTIQNG